ncbi:hypothetical protein CEXT_59321 [Caerostris extrusa]|uniref:Uncharacterized protein n=1 Tax=Caerostris extrusa TaxID=172846 RepID=A0AAV4PLZ6_CAEEX|nr:hypothetical protein CEXT_59321 [Caerostris extrusa]
MGPFILCSAHYGAKGKKLGGTKEFFINGFVAKLETLCLPYHDEDGLSSTVISSLHANAIKNSTSQWLLSQKRLMNEENTLMVPSKLFTESMFLTKNNISKSNNQKYFYRHSVRSKLYHSNHLIEKYKNRRNQPKSRHFLRTSDTLVVPSKLFTFRGHDFDECEEKQSEVPIANQPEKTISCAVGRGIKVEFHSSPNSPRGILMTPEILPGLGGETTVRLHWTRCYEGAPDEK